jgi:hypothetical protein
VPLRYLVTVFDLKLLVVVRRETISHNVDSPAANGLRPYFWHTRHFLTISKLSKDDEVSTEDVEVRKEDQDKINRFSSLHQRESAIEAELKQKQVRLSSKLLGKI